MRALSSGDQVRIVGTAEVGTVVDADNAGFVRVQVGGNVQYLDREDLELVASEPHLLLAAGQLGDSESHLLRLSALFLLHAYQYDARAGLSSARIEPQPHQVFVAHRVTQRKLVPRMILADEVGLGKTIEAGLILKELRARRQADRVLVLAPASLSRQWQAELSSKFNEQFEIMDGPAAKHLGRGSDNPFAKVDSVICSLPFSVTGKRTEQIVEAGWDLVIVDEAHRARRIGRAGGSAQTTKAYELVDELKEFTPGLLLLTATPMQLHASELHSMIELVEPGLYRAGASFDHAKERIPALNEVMRALQQWEALHEEERILVLDRHGYLLADPDTGEVPAASDLFDETMLNAAIDRLVAQHPLADVLIRNRKADLGLAGRRRAERVDVELTPDERDVYEAVTEYISTTYTAAIAHKQTAVGFLMVAYQKMLTSSSFALRASFKKRILALEKRKATLDAKLSARLDLDALDDPAEDSLVLETLEETAFVAASLELEIDRLHQLIAQLGSLRDSKIERLVRLLEERLADETAKAVVFTQFKETQRMLISALEANGLSCVLFNGDLNADEKESSVRRFRDSARVLVSTESGGEGRNLQFANVLVNFDLPWNPMKVEQRIGRLDRIGQKREVEIYNLISVGTLEDRIFDVLANRIKLFEETVGALDPILGTIPREIERIALGAAGADQRKAFEGFAQDLERQVAQARLQQKVLADFVLDRASFRRDVANRLLGHDPLATQADVEHVVRQAVAYLGGTVATHHEAGVSISLSPQLAARLGMQRKVTRGVFEPELAREYDDLDFLACGHELIDRVLRMAAELPNASTGGRRSREVPEGVWLEVVWRVQADLDVPYGRLVRHLVGPDLVVRSTDFERLSQDDQPVEIVAPGWVADAVEASRKQFEADHVGERTELRVKFEGRKELLLARLDRIHKHQQLRLMTLITQYSEWLSEREAVAVSAKDQKIMPARRGQLAKARERLQELQDEQAVKRQQIVDRRLSVRAEVLSASLVEGAA